MEGKIRYFEEENMKSEAEKKYHVSISTCNISMIAPRQMRGSKMVLGKFTICSKNAFIEEGKMEDQIK